jgi:hypothetical protein
MHDASVRLEFGEIGGPYSGSLNDIDQLLVNYISFRQGAYLSYRTTNAGDIQAFPEMMSKSVRYVQHELPTDVLRTRDDYESILELATR